MADTTKEVTKSEPAKSGDKPIESFSDTEAVKAQEKADKEAAALAEERLAPTDNQMTYEEYDKVGKGDDYEPTPESAAHTKAADEALAKAQAEGTTRTADQGTAARSAVRPNAPAERG